MWAKQLGSATCLFQTDCKGGNAALISKPLQLFAKERNQWLELKAENLWVFVCFFFPPGFMEEIIFTLAEGCGDSLWPLCRSLAWGLHGPHVGVGAGGLLLSCSKNHSNWLRCKHLHCKLWSCLRDLSKTRFAASKSNFLLKKSINRKKKLKRFRVSTCFPVL